MTFHRTFHRFYVTFRLSWAWFVEGLHRFSFFVSTKGNDFAIGEQWTSARILTRVGLDDDKPTDWTQVASGYM